MMWALIGGNSYYRTSLFPCRLQRSERVEVIGYKKEIDRLQMMLCEPPVDGDTNLYLMLDESTVCVKIGRARNVKYRERTLQAEKPQITLMRSWPASNRHETELHKRYAQYRVRGEWFALTAVEVQAIIDYMDAEQVRQHIYDRLWVEWERAKKWREKSITKLDTSALTGDPITIEWTREEVLRRDTERGLIDG